jgi:aminoglycoside phosphotransferase (APT) family kinase protein
MDEIMIDIKDEGVLCRYLSDHQRVPDGEEPRIVALSGGVSCDVLLVETSRGSFVLKQARPKLRVQEDWYSDMTRVKIEQDCLRYYERVVPDLVPRFLFYDEENYLFAMEAAPPGAAMWKSHLMQGAIDFSIALRIASALAKVHNAAATDKQAWETFANQNVFIELRIDPYLRKTATRHPGLAQTIDREIERLLENRQTLVHGDFSPKNILVADNRLFILDFEVAHIGDPSFDLGFLTNHFLLKAVKNKAWAPGYLALMAYAAQVYLRAIDFAPADRLEADTVRTLALLFLARVDGKSPAEYITDESDKTLIRALSYQILGDGLATFDQVAALAGRTLRASHGPSNAA